MTFSHKENCVCVEKAIKQESLCASGNAHSSECTHIWSDVLFSTLKILRKILIADCTKVSTSLFHFYYTRLRLTENWNIITFLLVMVVWIHNFSNLFVRPSTERTVDYDFWFFLFVFCSFCCTFLRDTFIQYQAKDNNSRTENCQRAEKEWWMC